MVEVKIGVNGGSGDGNVMQNLEASCEGEAFALGVRDVAQVLQAS